MDKNKANVPKIRFPGFTDPWKKCKLSEICEEFQSGKNIKAEDIKENGVYPVYGANGLRGYSDTYNHDGIYALIGRQGALCGNMNISYGKAYFTEHAIAVRANKSSETRFLFYLLGKMNLGQYSGQSAQPGLAVNKLLELSSFVPNNYEQKQISEFFILLDNLITLQQCKLNHLQDKKKSLLQKMFPKNGEEFPELRFPGFTDPWEQRKLGELCDVYDGTHQTPNYQNSGIMFISVENINSLKSDKFISEKDFIKDFNIFPEKGDVLMTRIGDIGTANVVESNEPKAYYVSLALLKKKSLDPYFLKESISTEMVKSDLWKRTLHIAFPKKINKNEIVEVLVPYPEKREEQEKIGTFFKEFDNLIALHQRKLKHLQEQKKALLQQIFI